MEEKLIFSVKGARKIEYAYAKQFFKNLWYKTKYMWSFSQDPGTEL